MENIFLQLLNMSITASWITLAVIALRFLLKKAPKWIMSVLWGFVALRLICPFSIESVLSLIPSTETVSPDIMISESPVINSGIVFINHAVNPVISGSLSQSTANGVNPLQMITLITSIVWAIGIAALLIYTAISYVRLRLKVREAVKTDNGTWFCDNISTPFILGIFRPRIYLPSSMSEADISYVISHEKAHLKRLDYIWKPLGFLLLTVYWFNPVLWVAYILLCRDIELACDEKVIRDMGENIKKPYSEALINCSVPRRMISACPLAFGEVGVKGRIKNVLNYKKPAFWVIVLAVAACIVTAVCLLTNPIDDKENTTLSDSMSGFIYRAVADNYTLSDVNNYPAIDIKVMKTEKRGNQTKLYMWVLYEEYSYKNGILFIYKGFHVPTVITVNETGDNGSEYELVDYWVPRDALYLEDIKANFPKKILDKALDSEWCIEEQEASCLEQAKIHYGITTQNADGDDADYVSYFAYYPSIDSLSPNITLSRKDSRFSFIYSLLSSYIAVGTYEQTSEKLTLKTDDGKYTYVFEVRDEDTLKFDASQSSEIPKFIYSSGEEPKCPVPDGMMFSKSDRPPYYDRASADIDNDGIKEDCILGYGQTSGFFTFTFTAVVDVEIKYDNCYYTGWYDLSFFEKYNKLYVKGITQDGVTHLFDISVSEGNIILSENGKAIGTY